MTKQSEQVRGRINMAIPNMWRTKKQRYSLQGEVCNHCERAVFPPRQVCPHCHKPMHEHGAKAAPIFDFGAMAAPLATQVVMAGDD
ncbi:MAG: zinc ribbon domain-containing protein [Caldilinea sp.]|uniref:zinc ribbon domain-containing protein n=1 Tax=Caldilinea sp. TaxID=2293560 RepID=UPI002B865FCB|nr:zinc ribbon domain-containing protein [Caldilinea sp.]HRA65387.1 zinc ribbon domain-containing protein [Caldilinea sp.]